MIIWIIIVVLIFIIILEVLRETHTFKVTHYHIHSSKLSVREKDKNIMVLSDLHNQVYGKNNEKLIKRIKEEGPDLILIAGDMVIAKKGESNVVAEELIGQIFRLCPIYYANGNHEQRMREAPQSYDYAYDKYRKNITRNRVIMLENKSYIRDWENELATVTGLEIPSKYYEKFTRAKLSVKEIEKKVGKASTDCYQILIAHNPIYAKTYAQWGADLVISGHFHGGLVRLPYIGGLISPQAQPFPRYSGGLYEEGKTKIVVSRGLGNHTVRLRLFNRAEIVMLHLNGEK